MAYFARMKLKKLDLIVVLATAVFALVAAKEPKETLPKELSDRVANAEPNERASENDKTNNGGGGGGFGGRTESDKPNGKK